MKPEGFPSPDRYLIAGAREALDIQNPVRDRK